MINCYSRPFVNISNNVASKVAVRENSSFIRELESKAKTIRYSISMEDKKTLNSLLTGNNPDKITIGELAFGLCNNLDSCINRLRVNINDKEALDLFNRTYEYLSKFFG